MDALKLISDSSLKKDVPAVNVGDKTTKKKLLTYKR